MNTKLWTRNYTVGLIVMFGIYMVSSILLSVMAIHAKNLTGLDTYAGLMVTTFTLGALGVRFLAGGLIDRFGSKRVIITGLIILVAGSIWLMMSQAILQVLIARVLQGIGFGLAATATSTLIATICHPDRLLEGISYLAVTQSLTAVIGPSIGFFIIGVDYDRFSVLFAVAVAVGIATFLLMLFEKSPHDVVQHEHTSKSGQTLIKWSLIVTPLLVLFMNALSQSALVSFLALYAISMNLIGVGSFFSINAVGMIASRFIMNKLVKKYGQFPMILLNTSIFALSIFFITQASTIGQLLLIAFPAGFAMGSIAPIINTNVIQTLPANKKGLANALYFSALDVGYGAGSIIWGLIAMNFGYQQVFYIAASLQVLGLLLILIHMRIVSQNNRKVSLNA